MILGQRVWPEAAFSPWIIATVTEHGWRGRLTAKLRAPMCATEHGAHEPLTQWQALLHQSRKCPCRPRITRRRRGSQFATIGGRA